jgi:two-component system cell cycle sensor histidine kinase/response regulator CckA
MTARPTEGEHAARCRAARAEVALALADSATPAGAARRVLQAVCENFSWEMAEYWGVDHAAGRLCRVAAWPDALPDDPGDGRTTLTPGETVAGQIRQSGRALWIADPGCAPACLGRWQSAAGFPAGREGGVSAVIVLFGRESRHAEADQLRAMAAIGDQIGRFAENTREAAELREREELFRLFAENSSDLIYLVDLEYRVVYASPSVGRMLGRVPKNPFEVIHPDDAAAARASRERVMANGKNLITVRVLDGAGNWRWMEAFNTLVRHRDRPHVMAICRDVTDRRRAEEASRQSREQYEELVANVDGIVWESDARTFEFLFVSRRAERLFGYPTEQWLREPGFWANHLHPDDRDRAVEFCVTATREGRDHTFEYRMLASDGRAVWLRDVVSVVVEGGTATRLRGIMVDITERKHAEEALRRSEQMLRRAQAIAGVGSWVFDVREGLFDGSEEGHRMCGWGPGRHSGEEMRAITHRDDLERVTAAWRASLAGAPFDVEHRLVVGGEVRWVNVRAEPETDADGQVVRITGVTQETTARRLLEEKLRQAQKMEAVGRLAGGIAHDFNNLLTVINGYAAMAVGRTRPNDPLHGPLSEVQKAGERAADLTRQLLAFGRKQILQPRVIDLNALVGEMTRMLKRLIGEDVELIVALDPRPCRAMVDPSQFEQVLMNLAVNSRDAMPGGGKITVETRNVEVGPPRGRGRHDVQPGRYVRLTVSDTGHGMDEATRSHLFEPFFTTKGVGKGTGLGLAVVEGIVRQSGGHVDVDSEVGRGTAFRIHVPAVEEPVAPASRGSVNGLPVPSGTETVLLVDDDDGVRTFIGKVLRAGGYEVLEAGDGEAALRAARDHPGPIHLLVTDVIMPRMSGRKLADLLTGERPGLKILFASGYSTEIVGRHEILEGGGNYLPKPFSPSALSRKVRELLDARPSGPQAVATPVTEAGPEVGRSGTDSPYSDATPSP